MTHRRLCCAVMCVILFTAIGGQAQLISGSATAHLSGPATREVTDQVRGEAFEKLKIDLLAWMGENQGVSFDTANYLDKFNFDAFALKCLKKAKEESAFNGKNWTCSYTLVPADAQEVINQSNAGNDSQAIEHWNKFTAAVSQKNNALAYVEGVEALGLACAHIGAPIRMPGVTGHDFIDDVRKEVQAFFDKMKVQCNEMVIKGKAGQLPEVPPAVTITLDSAALAGASFTAVLPSGEEPFSTISNEHGVASLDQMKIPFVANGTFLSLSMDLGKVLGSPELIEAKDFGISLNNGQDQTFMFKLTKPTFTLDYTASSASKLQMPSEFSTDLVFRKFLEDSCFLEPASASVPADLIITMTSQMSNYNYDETEESSVKITSLIKIQEVTQNPPKTEQQEMEFEKRYEKNVEIPLGLFFWETNIKIRATVKSLLDKL